MDKPKADDDSIACRESPYYLAQGKGDGLFLGVAARDLGHGRLDGFLDLTLHGDDRVLSHVKVRIHRVSDVPGGQLVERDTGGVRHLIGIQIMTACHKPADHHLLVVIANFRETFQYIGLMELVAGPHRYS